MSHHPQSPRLSADVHRQLLASFNIFHPSCLATEEDIAIAVNVLEGSLDNESIGPIILCSLQLEHPYAFEFIVSCKLVLFAPVERLLTPTTAVSEDSSEVVLKYILDRLPSDADGFRTSLGYHVLSRLSRCLSRLPYPSDQQPVHFDNYQKDIEAAPALLEDISRLLQGEHLDGAEAEGNTNKKSKQRGKSQRSKVTSVAYPEINNRLFRDRGHEVPRDRQSAEGLVHSIIATQKDALKVRLPPAPLRHRHI
jgi:hypothetical protein